MNLAAAIAVRKDALQGNPVPAHQLHAALRMISRGRSISQGKRDLIKPEELTNAERERANAILIYRLGLACGKFNDWKGTT